MYALNKSVCCLSALGHIIHTYDVTANALFDYVNGIVIRFKPTDPQSYMTQAGITWNYWREVTCRRFDETQTAFLRMIHTENYWNFHHFVLSLSRHFFSA